MTTTPEQNQLAIYRERIAALESERQSAISSLREICKVIGDNDWPDNLHLGDAIEKQLGDYILEDGGLVDRLEGLEKEKDRAERLHNKFGDALERIDTLEAEIKQLRATLETIALYEDYEDMEEGVANTGLSYVAYLELAYDNVREEALSMIASERKPARALEQTND